MKLFGTKLVALSGFVLASGIALESFAEPRQAAKEGFADPAKTFRAVEGFQSPLSLTTKAGKTMALKVGAHTWSIDGELGRQNIRVTDFTLFHVRGGKIRVFADGKEELKSADMYWTAPAGATVTLQVKGETALLDAITIATK